MSRENLHFKLKCKGLPLSKLYVLNARLFTQINIIRGTLANFEFLDILFVVGIITLSVLTSHSIILRLVTKLEQL